MKLKECKKYYFDQDSANRVLYFIENHIRHSKGEYGGKLFKLDDWQKKIVSDIFGWKHKKTNLRRFRTCYLSVPRKNGKSTLISAISLYMLLGEKEPSAECYVAAGDRAQAGIIFDIASTMVKMDSQLNTNLKVYRNSIVHEKSNSSLKAISADASTKYGFNASFIAMDELFVQRDDSLWTALTTSTGARSQPLTIAITTAGYNKESLCYKIQEYGDKVSKGIIDDPTFYYCVYGADIEDDWTDKKIWIKANPGIKSGMVKLDYLKTECEKAQRMPSHEANFRMLHLNQWVSSEQKWISDRDWMKCNQGEIDYEYLRGLPCYAGLDLASVRDITALVLLFVDEDRYITLPYFFTPKENAYIRSRRDGVDYVTWNNQGHMDLTDGDVTDYNFIKKKILDLGTEFNIRQINYDRWNASQLVLDCINEGAPMNPYGQGFLSMSAPTKELEKIVLNKQLNHSGNPVLRWMISNVLMKIDPSGNIKPDKAKSTEKIDGLVALIMALGAAMNADQIEDSSYNDRGITFL